MSETLCKCKTEFLIELNTTVSVAKSFANPPFLFSSELKRANEGLQEKYKIEGYPTIIVLNGDGKKVGELGYQPGGPKAFIAELDKLKNKN